jgi:hypothetical protein
MEVAACTAVGLVGIVALVLFARPRRRPRPRQPPKAWLHAATGLPTISDTVLCPPPLPPGWSFCNPALTWRDGQLCGVARASNYRLLENGTYAWCGPATTQLVTFRVDPQRLDACLDVRTLSRGTWEDARWLPGQTGWLAADTGQAVARPVLIAGGTARRLEADVDAPHRGSKNWLPLADGVHAIHSWFPLTVVDLRTGRTTVTYDGLDAPQLEFLRGSAAPLPFSHASLPPVRALAMGHVVFEMGARRRAYVHYFVGLGADGTVVALSRPLWLHAPRTTEFAMSLCAGASPSTVLVGYGFEDAEARVAVVSHAAVAASFVRGGA